MMLEMSSMAMSILREFPLVKRRNFSENLTGPEEGFAGEDFRGEKREGSSKSGGKAAIPPDEEFEDASAGLPGGARPGRRYL